MITNGVKTLAEPGDSLGLKAAGTTVVLLLLLLVAVLVVVVGRLEPRAKVLVTGGSAGSIS